MAEAMIFVQVAIFGLNIVFGAIWALIVAASMLMGGFVAADPNGEFADIMIGGILLLGLPAAGAVWFLISDHARSGERLVFLLPVFWSLPLIWGAILF